MRKRVSLWGEGERFAMFGGGGGGRTRLSLLCARVVGDGECPGWA